MGAGRQLVGYVTGEAALDGSALRRRCRSLAGLHGAGADRGAGPAAADAERQGRSPCAAGAGGGWALGEHVAPRTATETALAAIWSELLRQPTVGVTDNFFELGGDSIVSLQVVSRARRAGLLIEPRDVFRHQTSAGAGAGGAGGERAAGDGGSRPCCRSARSACRSRFASLSEDVGSPIALEPGGAAGSAGACRTGLCCGVRSPRWWSITTRCGFGSGEDEGGWRAEHGAAPAADDLLWLRADVRARAR